MDNHIIDRPAPATTNYRRGILRCADGSFVKVLFDVLMVQPISFLRCADGRHL